MFLSYKEPKRVLKRHESKMGTTEGVRRGREKDRGGRNKEQ
jgi:hypothetical protein